jgi:integrase
MSKKHTLAAPSVAVLPDFLSPILNFPVPAVDTASPAPANIPAPPVQATQRKRGRNMSRRTGQKPTVRVGRRKDGTKYFFFQYWIDVPGQEERQRKTEILGPVKSLKVKATENEGTVPNGLTKSEAERRKLEILSEINSRQYKIPSSFTFTDCVKHYRQVFAPKMLRASTLNTADGHLKKHLEDAWKDVPVEYITIDTVNEFAWKKKKEGLSWVTIKNILRTMQRVISCASKDKKPTFSINGLTIPEKDKLQMRIEKKTKQSFTWEQAESVVEQIKALDSLGDARKQQYSTLVLLASASGLRISELLALRVNDFDFSKSTLRVDESSDQKSGGKIGPCKNAAAYRTVYMLDREGKRAMAKAKEFIPLNAKAADLVFRSRRQGPLTEQTILVQGLYPALDRLGIERDGFHALRYGCNTRWQLAGLAPVVIRQQMGHSSSDMTDHYTSTLSPEQVEAAFESKFGRKIDVLENDGKRETVSIAA